MSPEDHHRASQTPLPVSWTRGGKQILQEHKKGNTFRSIMLRQPLSYRPSLVFRGPVLLRAPLILSQREMTIFGHTSVSQVCMHDKAAFVRTHFLPVPLRSTASRSLQIKINQVFKYNQTPCEKQKVRNISPLQTPSLYTLVSSRIINTDLIFLLLFKGTSPYSLGYQKYQIWTLKTFSHNR